MLAVLRVQEYGRRRSEMSNAALHARTRHQPTVYSTRPLNLKLKFKIRDETS